MKKRNLNRRGAEAQSLLLLRGCQLGFVAWFIELAKRFGFEIMKNFEPQRRKGAEFTNAKRVAGYTFVGPNSFDRCLV